MKATRALALIIAALLCAASAEAQGVYNTTQTPVLVVNLPICNSTLAATGVTRWTVSDSANPCASSNTLTGGGTNRCPVTCDGIGWNLDQISPIPSTSGNLVTQVCPPGAQIVAITPTEDICAPAGKLINFTTLPAQPINGTLFYCVDCDAPFVVPSACTSQSDKTGAWAKVINGVYICTY